MTKELMDKYKAGELDNGYYWVKDSCDRISPLYMLLGIKLQYEDVVDILAPVPSYEEWSVIQAQLSEHKDNCCCQKNEVLLLKIDKLEKQLEIAKCALAKSKNKDDVINQMLELE